MLQGGEAVIVRIETWKSVEGDWRWSMFRGVRGRHIDGGGHCADRVEALQRAVEQAAQRNCSEIRFADRDFKRWCRRRYGK